MPFTFSHPAAVIPFAGNHQLVLSALVIGSMTPDFESFLHLSTDVSFAHSLPGIGIFCLPSGVIMFLLFHLLLKKPLLALAPKSHQKRLLPLVHNTQLSSPRRWASILCSLALGAMTHLLWDAATHEYGWFVMKVPILQSTVLQIGTRSLKTYTILQHGGSLSGGLVLLLFYWNWYRTAAPADSIGDCPDFSGKRKLGILSAIIFSGGLAGSIYAAIRTGTGQPGAHFLKDTVLLGVPCVVLGTIVFSISHAITRPKTQKR